MRCSDLIGWSLAKFSTSGDISTANAAAVPNSPKRIKARQSSGNGDFVLRVNDVANQYKSASGANTPNHSYQVQLKTKKYAREKRARRAAPVAGWNNNTTGMPAYTATPLK